MGDSQARPVGTATEPEPRDCTLGELVELIGAEGEVSPAIQALIVLAQLQQAALATSGDKFTRLAERTMPVGVD